MAGAELPEPVSMDSFSFEVNKETGHARVVVEYTYQDQSVFGSEGGAGPEPTFAQLPGLSYDLSVHAIIYDDEGRTTICATVRERKVIFWKKLVVKPTGSCIVTADLADHSENDG